MKHFLRIAQGVDIIPILNALHDNDYLWNEHKLRTTHPLSPHQETSDIWVFFNEIPESAEAIINDIQVRPYRAWLALPQIRNVILDLMRRVDGTQLGRVLITKLPPGKSIPAHTDQGAPVEFYTRYQIPLQSLPGCVFQIEDEKMMFQPGEVWRIDNAAEHSVTNNSADDRIVIIADIHSC